MTLLNVASNGASDEAETFNDFTENFAQTVPGQSIGGKMVLTAEQIESFKHMVEKLPLKHMGQPEEIAAAALYFASDDTRFTTGAELRIDGGLTLL